MAHWFHRNPLKATAPTNFEVKMVVQDVEALKVLRYVALKMQILMIRVLNMKFIQEVSSF